MSASKINLALTMGLVERMVQNLYTSPFRHGSGEARRVLGNLNSYPQSRIGLCFAFLWWSVRFRLLDTQRRLLRAAFGSWIGPVLGQLGRRRLRLILKFVPRRYLGAVMRRLHAFQADAKNTRYERHAEGRSSH
jgi:hypothetical protein